jgi:hypothetical protein
MQPSTLASTSLVPLLMGISLSAGCSLAGGGGGPAFDATSTTSGDEGTGAGSGEEGTGGSEEGPKYDVASQPDLDPPAGCDKIDFLFVIDNSGSMSEEQTALIASFPGFIDHIRDHVKGQDHHLMVTDTDVAVSKDQLGQQMGDQCDPHPECCAQTCQTHETCNGVPCDQLTECDYVLGAGQTKDKAGEPCGIDGGVRYMVEGQDDLDGTFACVAEVGTHGNGGEKPMQAIMMAVSDELGAPAACNDGFLRDDALLVITFITDEEDGSSIGDPGSWHDAVVAAKGGDETAVVVLGLVADGDLVAGTCPAPVGAPTLRAFADGFTWGSWASVCEPDYAPYFADAVSVVDEACDAFEPPG